MEMIATLQMGYLGRAFREKDKVMIATLPMRPLGRVPMELSLGE